MPSLPIVEDLDVVKQICSCLRARPIPPAVDTLPFQRREEALHAGIVKTVGLAAHGTLNPVIDQEPLKGLARILAATIRVMEQSGLWLRPAGRVNAFETT